MSKNKKTMGAQHLIDLAILDTINLHRNFLNVKKIYTKNTV